MKHSQWKRMNQTQRDAYAEYRKQRKAKKLANVTKHNAEFDAENAERPKFDPRTMYFVEKIEKLPDIVVTKTVLRPRTRPDGVREMDEFDVETGKVAHFRSVYDIETRPARSLDASASAEQHSAALQSVLREALAAKKDIESKRTKKQSNRARIHRKLLREGPRVA